MASSNLFPSGNDFIKVMERFPCLFNIGMVKMPGHMRGKLMILKLEEDMEREEEFEGEMVMVLNVLSWLYFQGGDMEKAKETNDNSLYIDHENIVTLGNRAFLEWYSGTKLTDFLKHLETLQSQLDFPEKELNANGAQANFLFRLGGHYNMSRSVQMYTTLVQRCPDNYEWKYYLCLGLRRIAVMERKFEDNMNLEATFRGIAENATDKFWKSAALGELVVLIARKPASVKEVEDLIEKAHHLIPDSPVVLRKCGIALIQQGNPRGIYILEKSVSLKKNTLTHHALAKAYNNFKLTKNLDKTTCDRKAVSNFLEAYNVSMKDSIRPLLDLAYMLLCRNRIEESNKYYGDLIKNWSLMEIHSNPFFLAKVFEGWYLTLKKSERRGRTADPLFCRYLSIALSTSLEQFKRNASICDKNIAFEHIIDPSTRIANYKSSKYLFDLVRDSTGEHSARQALMRMNRQRKLENNKCIGEEIEKLLEKDQPGEALLMLDMLALQENNRSPVSEDIYRRAIVEEAQWQLAQGLISCKLLFHRMFNRCHSSLFEDDDDEQAPGAEVLILQDSLHWKPFLQSNSVLNEDDVTGIARESKIYEDIIRCLLDLEVITNPWLPFSGSNQPDTEEFSATLKQFKVRLVLIIVDDGTCKEFLHMVDFLISKSLSGPSEDVARVKADVAILCNSDANFKEEMPNLADVRSFHASENGFVLRNDAKPDMDWMGTEVLDAFFSGKVENAVKFCKFLAPAT